MLLHHQPGQARDAAEDAEAARRDGIVEGVDLAVVAEQLGEAAEVEQVLVRAGARCRRAPPAKASSDRARRGSRARARPCRRRRRPSSPRAASRSAGPRCRARRCSARSRRAMRVTSSERWSTVRTSCSVAPPSNSSAVRRVETWSRRVRYLSSVASAWLALASTTGMSSRMYLRAVDVERDDLAALGDGDDAARRSAWRRARPCGGGCRSPRRGSSGPASAGRCDQAIFVALAFSDDRAVHLRELVEQLRRVVDVELDAAREEEASSSGSPMTIRPPVLAWTMLSMPSRSAVPGATISSALTSRGS